MYKGYQLKLIDQYDIAAFMASRIASAFSGKRIKQEKMYDRKKAEKRLFDQRKERNPDDIRERYERAKRIAEEVRAKHGRRTRGN